MKTYPRSEVEKFRAQHDVTPNGVVFDWWLVGAAGAGFCLIRESRHTDADIETAKSYLSRDRDVVGSIRVATVIEPSVA